MTDDMTTRLAEITANLDNYIEARAREIAAPRIAAAEARAEQQVAELKDEHARTQQRSAALEKELRRQIKALDGHMNQCPEVARKRTAWRGGQNV